MKAFVLPNRDRDDSASWMAGFVVAVIATVLASAYVVCVFLNMVPIAFSKSRQLGEAFSVAPWLYGIVLFFTGYFVYQLQKQSPHSGLRKLSTSGLLQMLGVQSIDSRTDNPYLRRLVNINEEIAIAAGRHPAQLYWMEGEQGINAFTAGMRAEEASICVSEGALRHLARAELQAVVAHEYGHVMCGDVKRNTLMIRWLALLMPSGFEDQPSQYFKGLVVIAALTAVCFVVGFAFRDLHGYALLGFLCLVLGVIAWLPSIIVRKLWRFGATQARLSHAALSRERELEADALSAQFTRDPESLAGALRKIAGLRNGTHLHSRNAAMFSHMCIAPALISDDDSAYASHPGIEERLSALGFPLSFEEKRRLGSRGPEVLSRYAAEVDRELGLMQVAPADTTVDAPAEHAPANDLRNIPPTALDTQPDVAFATKLLAAIPDDLRLALRHAEGARAAARALLGPASAGIADDELTRGFRKLLNTYGPRYRLPLLSLATPALQRLQPDERQAFVAELRLLISADGKVSLHELVYFVLLTSALRGPPVAASGEPLSDAYAIVLGTAAHAFSEDADEAATAFAAGARHLPFSLEMPSRAKLSVASLESAFERLRDVGPRDRHHIARAVGAAVARDGAISISELEFVRAASAAVGIPIPPMSPELTTPAGR